MLVQRGGMHTWVNKGDAPAVMAASIVLPRRRVPCATPVDVDGKLLHTHYPTNAK